MARQLEHLVEEPRPCSYLEDRSATLEHRILLDVTLEETEALLVRGWRRFGPDYFRPRCAPCSLCVPTRIPVERFEPSKSQRRARDKCKELEIRIGPPRFDEERLALYHAWHAHREEARGWSEAHLDERSYRIQFSMPHPAAREIAYVDPSTGRLVGLALSDLTPRSMSALYFFYDPAWSKRSIGTANVVSQVAIARRFGRQHLYLGYRVDACPSLAYKATFRPQERLVGWPELDEEPVWASAPEPRAADGAIGEADREPSLLDASKLVRGGTRT
jgi:arginine-tRNA-protein transferase